MRNRRVGTLTATGVGTHSISFRAEPQGYLENCHIQVIDKTGSATFTSQVFGTMEAARAAESAITTQETGNHLYRDIPVVPYMRAVIDVTVGVGDFEVWIYE